MGNNQSSGGSTFRRGTGSLGLSKSQLEARCKPSGLYECCAWEDKAIRRQIGDGKIAARLIGKEDREHHNSTDQECPICFLNYSEINILKCCKATICTECYLQVQDPKERNSPCPFCNQPHMSVTIAKKLDETDVKKRDEEEQKVIEATIRARANSVATSVGTSSSTGADGSPGEGEEGGGGGEGFGSNLNRSLRTRSMSGDSSSLHKSTRKIPTSQSPLVLNESSVMTPEERRALENEMRSQINHPILEEMRRADAARRESHDREYDRQSSERFSRLQRDFMLRYNRDLDALNRLDRLSVRDSGSEESGSVSSRRLGRRHRSRGSRFGSRSDRRGRGMNDLYLLETAAFLLSMQERERRNQESTEGGEGSANNENNSEDSSAANGNGNGGTGGTGSSADSTDEVANNPLLSLMRPPDGSEGNVDFEERLRTLSERSQRERMINLPWMDMELEHPIDSLFESGFLERSIVSEEEQMAMAIAMSLREAEAERERNRSQSNNNDNDDNGNGNDNDNSDP